MKRNFTSKINENRPGYKETFAGWIPNDWEYVRAQDITELSAGGTPSTLVDDYWGGDILWMRSGDLNLKRVCDVKGRITNKGLDNSSAFVIPKHSVLIGLAGQGKTRGTVAINEVELSANQSVAAFIPDKTKSHYLYIFYDLEHRYDELRRLSTGDGGRGGLNLKILGNLRFALPPLTEQKEIVETLITWDKAIELVGKQIEAKQWLKKGLMQQLLTGKMRFPGFDGGWREYKIGDISHLIAGGTPSTRVPQYWGGNIRWMKSGDIHLRRIYDVENKITQEGLDNSSAKMLPVNSVLVALAGQGKTRGTVAINKVELSTNQSIAAIIPDKKHLNYEFLFYNLDFRYEELRKLSTGDGGRGGLNLGLLRSIKLFTPSVKEQKRIVNVLANIEYEIAKLQEKIRALQKQKQGLMQKLLTGEVRVKV